MSHLFQIVLFKPIFNVLVGLYNILPGHDIGLAIIALTVFIKLLLYPLMNSSIKAQKSLQDIQPHVNELKKQHAGDKQALAQETMKLYKQHKVNPLASCLPVLVQIPILLALYFVLRAGLGNADFSLLYSFVSNPGSLNPVSFGFIDLAKPNYILAVLSGLAQFWQAKMLMTKRPPKVAGEGGKDEDFAAIMNKQMTYFMPVVTVLVGLQLPGGLTLYWLVSTLLTALQQLYIFKKRDTAVTAS